MTPGLNANLPLASNDAAALFRLLAEAPDTGVFYLRLREGVHKLLPGVRLDLLTNQADEAAKISFSTAEGLRTAAPGALTPASYVSWLRARGYAAVATLALNATGRHVGWMVLARHTRAFEDGIFEMAGQLAALIALRLSHDLMQQELAEHDSTLRRLEVRLRELEDLRLRATLVAGTAHNMSNLFALVLGHAQLLQKEAPLTLQPDLGVIAKAADDGHLLLRRMLAEPAPLPPAAAMPVALLPSVVRDAVRLTRPYWDGIHKIVVQTALAPVPAVRGYTADLREVLVNLIMNAVHAMPAGGTLTIRTHLAGEQVLAEVSDTGVGIPSEQQHAIFRSGMTTRTNGTGLGLSVSRMIIEGYGGTLTVQSTPNQGATFTVALPATWSLDLDRERGGTPRA